MGLLTPTLLNWLRTVLPAKLHSLDYLRHWTLCEDLPLTSENYLNDRSSTRVSPVFLDCRTFSRILRDDNAVLFALGSREITTPNSFRLTFVLFCLHVTRWGWDPCSLHCVFITPSRLRWIHLCVCWTRVLFSKDTDKVSRSLTCVADMFTKLIDKSPSQCPKTQFASAQQK